MATLIQIHPQDNVAVALRSVDAGCQELGVTIADPIPAGHKVALRPIPAGENVTKYGYVIGRAACAIAPGQHVHSHNLQSTLTGKLEETPYRSFTSAARSPRGLTFDGYRRDNGRVGIRNEIWIIPTVGCTNQASQQIAQAATAQLLSKYPNVEGIYAFPHPFGCSQLGDDLQHTQRILSALINHPNAAAVLVLGLGCENNQLQHQLTAANAANSPRIRYFNTQQVTDELEEGLKAVEELLQYASKFRRQPIPAGELTIGMKCGGSDGFSGITANPLVGRVADLLCSEGGTVLLTEVPEMFGAEQVLLERACDRKVFDSTISLVNDFRGYFRKHNEPVDENPSPGNREGGISTLAEKSLGCVQKGGTSPVRQILAYGQQAGHALGGVTLINGPGNDGVSGTCLASAGANLILFTTGRGTPMGFPVPTLKISTNSDLATRKPKWIDFNAGPLATGESTFDDMAQQLMQLILDVASGKAKARNELSNNREIAIWKDGVTL